MSFLDVRLPRRCSFVGEGLCTESLIDSWRFFSEVAHDRAGSHLVSWDVAVSLLSLLALFLCIDTLDLLYPGCGLIVLYLCVVFKTIVPADRRLIPPMYFGSVLLSVKLCAI